MKRWYVKGNARANFAANIVAPPNCIACTAVRASPKFPFDVSARIAAPEMQKLGIGLSTVKCTFSLIWAKNGEVPLEKEPISYREELFRS